MRLIIFKERIQANGGVYNSNTPHHFVQSIEIDMINIYWRLDFRNIDNDSTRYIANRLIVLL